MVHASGAGALQDRELCLPPIFLDDGSFYGTLCAIDPQPRTVSGLETIGALEELARQASEILSRKVRETSAG